MARDKNLCGRGCSCTGGGSQENVAMGAAVLIRAANDPSVFAVMEKAPTSAFSWLKVPTSAFTFKTLC